MTKKRITTRATALFSGVTFESPLATLTARRLTPADVPQAVALTAEAGWNQIDTDWRMMLALGDGLGLFDSGKLVATAIVLPYPEPAPARTQKFGWISMVLVTPAWQRRGLARWMLQRCIGALQGAGYMPMLDATPAGREVYLRLGFVEGMEIQRLEAAHLSGINLESVSGGRLYMPMFKGRGPDAAWFDRSIFGADRAGLIEAIRERDLPAYIAERDGAVDGIAMLRDGQRAFHVGPVLATEPGIAAQILLPFGMYTRDRPVFMDVPSHQTAFIDALSAAGFKLQRKLTRMYLGAKAPGATPERCFAIAGPELG